MYTCFFINLHARICCPRQVAQGDKNLMEEAQAQAQVQAQQIEDQGQLLELWQRRFKRTGIHLLMVEKPPNICSKMP